MSPETAREVFFILATLLWIIWIMGARFAFSSLNSTEEAVRGESTVRGDAETVSRRIAAQLAAYTSSGGGPLQITERTATRIRFQRMPGLLLRRGPFFDEGAIVLTPAGDSVRVQYEVSLRRILKGARLALRIICFGWGGLFVLGIPVAVWLFAVTSDDPARRWQSFQTFQMIHGAWPPYLFAVLIRFTRGIPDRYMQALIANAAHTA